VSVFERSSASEGEKESDVESVPTNLVVRKRWTILILLVGTAVAIRATAQANATAPSIEYRNAQYGFCFSLPSSWKGYSIVTEHWDGSPPDSQSFTKGPLLLIRHPNWTEQNPHEDIPIMIFTHEQWRLVEQEKLIVSPASFGPGELGRNARYVFALPPRYLYDFAIGWQEVAKLTGSSFHAPCEAHSSRSLPPVRRQ
jgi:hypothetical protein